MAHANQKINVNNDFEMCAVIEHTSVYKLFGERIEQLTKLLNVHQ
jgi:hypothetical protein